MKRIDDRTLCALSVPGLAALVLFDSKGTILEADRNFLEMLKYHDEQFDEMTWDDFAAGDDRAIDRLKLQQVREGGTSETWRTELIAKDGTHVPVVLKAARVTEQADRFIAMVFDASEMERPERKPRQLAGRLLHLYDEERRRIARELHDTTAQNLAALSMNLVMLFEAISDPERSRAILAECNTLTEECLKEIRSLSYMLYPPLLDELGLESALRAFLRMYERRTGITVDLVLHTQITRMDPQIELGVFRVAQEGLFNVQRHSGSEKAELRIEQRERRILVSVRDWGKGVREGAISPDSVGIAGMRERVHLLGGQFHIGPAAPGTLLRAVFPMER